MHKNNKFFFGLNKRNKITITNKTLVNHKNRFNKKGFTLIEVTISVVIISILATIITISFIGIQKKSRDSERLADATSLSEALESYYEINGEYPSCSKITQSPVTVKAEVLNDIEPDILADPLDDQNSNSIELSCSEIADLPIGEYVYVGDGSQECLTGGSCLDFKLQYRNESTGEIVTISSRRTTDVSNPTVPVIAAQQASSNVRLVITPVTCHEGVGQYSTSMSIDSGSWSEYSDWTTSAIQLTDATDNTNYRFKVQARCYIDDTQYSKVENSLIASITYDIMPSIPAFAVALSGANVLSTITAASCSAGTAQYAFANRINDGAWSEFSAWDTTLTSSQSANDGVKYGYKIKARCYIDDTHISREAASTEKTYIDPIPAPAATVVSQSTSGGTTTYSWTAVTCPVGTLSYQYRIVQNATAYGWTATTGTSFAYTTTGEGSTYYGQVQARCYNTNITSAWSTLAQASYYRTAPPAAYSISSSQTWNVLYATSNAVCTKGTLEYHWYANGGFWVGGGQYQSVGYQLGWNQDITLTVYSRCYADGVYTSWTQSSNTVSHTSLDWPWVSQTYGWRELWWSGGCPAYSWAANYYVSIYSTNWGWYQAWNNSGYWANQGPVWANGSIRVTIYCDGPWGTATQGSWQGHGPMCNPEVLWAQCTY